MSAPVPRTSEAAPPGGLPGEAAAPASRRPAILGFLVWLLARVIASTLRIHRENFHRVDEIIHEHGGAILVSWHGRTLIPANEFRGRGYWALISLSRDGEVQNHIFRRFGFQTIRGSTGRGGVRAAIQLARKLQEGGVVAFTPDGPRGPSHRAQEGVFFLAQRSGRPIVPLGLSARPRILLGSWDRYMIPLPFARAAFVVGEPLFVPSDLGDDQKREVAARLEAAIDAVEARAEELAGWNPARAEE